MRVSPYFQAPVSLRAVAVTLVATLVGIVMHIAQPDFTQIEHEGLEFIAMRLAPLED
jgi:type III secretory pathway component EscS